MHQGFRHYNSIQYRTWGRRSITRLNALDSRHGYDSIFYLNQLSLSKFWFDSTHDSQWLYKNRFKSAQYPKSISEVWFKYTHDSKSFRNILIQIDSWLKKLAGILIRIKSLLDDWNQLFISLTFLGLSLKFVDLFGGNSTKCLDSNPLMSQAVSWLESIPLMTQAAFQEWTQN